MMALPLWGDLARPALAQDVKGDVLVSADNGYARLYFRFSEELDVKVQLANNILTISFPRPVAISIDRIRAGAPEYMGVARRDPDGMAIRVALTRKVKLNSMTAGEKLFVDLLPDTWTGLAPGLPREVIEELARRARDGERRIRQQRLLAQQQRVVPVRVKVVTQPTFMRYVFDLPELIGIVADNAGDKLTLTFNATLRFDLADVIATLPPVIESVESEIDQEAALVRFNFTARVDVRTFREDNSYVVDVETADRQAERPDGTVRSDELSTLAEEITNRENAAGGPGAAPKSTPSPKAAPAPRADPASNPALAAPERSGASSPSPAPQTQPQRPPVQASPTPPLQQDEPRPAAPPPQAAAPTPATVPPPEDHPATEPGGAIRAAVKRNGDNLVIALPFEAPTPAAVFRRADTVWMVFDTDATVAIAALNAEQGKTIRTATAARVRNVALIRVKLERPQLISVAADGNTWVITLGSEVVEPTRPLQISRNIVAAARTSISIAIDEARNLHRVDDPEVGDSLFVVTASAPARGLLKAQDFVEFRALASAHGIALQALADDVTAELSGDKVVVSRPAGLSLSSAPRSGQGPSQRQVFDIQSWGADRQANFAQRRGQLVTAAAEAPESRRLAARYELARFYLARDMYAEAKAVLDVAVADSVPTTEDSAPIVLRAVANILFGRAEAALKDLSNPLVGNQHDAPLWRSLAQAQLGQWTEAREGFRNAEAAMITLPLEIQRLMLKDMVRVDLEVGDVTGAVGRLQEFEMIGVPRELEPSIAVLTGRLAEALGRAEDALRAYQVVHESWDRPAAAQGRLREIKLQFTRGNYDRATTLDALEALTATWRGDRTELEALQVLTTLYLDEGRFRDGFNAMRTALRTHPNADITRRIQDDARSTFDNLFLAGKSDAIPAIDALSLFYDFRELTPVGRRGDEVIRRLVDRLLAVDLLFQASELLQHQVDHRLQGAARAQVAARLALIYMTDRKPAKALAALRASRVSDLNNNLRNQRLLIEARALSDLGRHDVAYEIIANVPGPETVRLRADILWAGKKWGLAAEQLEALHGDRWKEFEPLNDIERSDIMRAAIAYALGEDAIGLARIRERYFSKMREGSNARAFDVITAPVGTSSLEFGEIVRSLAAVDTLQAFLRDLRQRYPDAGAPRNGSQMTPPATTPPASAPARATAG